MAGVIEKLYVGRTRTLLGNMAVLVRNAICIIADSALKYMSLSVLVLQNTVLILSMRYSRVLAGDMYFTTTAVVISESMKMFICLGIIFYQFGSFSEYISHLYESLIVNWTDTLKMSVPAIVYMIQNNLQYVAVSNLEAAVFQVRMYRL